MIFSTATGYALRALAVLPPDRSFTLAKDLARELGLPGPYLAKILQSLAHAGILESSRGPRGGFRLAKAAPGLTIGEVVQALEGPSVLDGCIMGFDRCGCDHPCPLHEAWGKVRTLLDSSLAAATVEALQGMAYRLRLPEVRLPEVRLPEVRLPEVRLPEVPS